MKVQEVEQIKKTRDVWGHTVEMIEFKSNGQEVLHWSDGIMTVYPTKRTHFFNCLLLMVKILKRSFGLIKLFTIVYLFVVVYYLIKFWNYIDWGNFL